MQNVRFLLAWLRSLLRRPIPHPLPTQRWSLYLVSWAYGDSLLIGTVNAVTEEEAYLLIAPLLAPGTMELMLLPECAEPPCREVATR